MDTDIDINQLLGQFLDLQEQWEEYPEHFGWDKLKALAAAGAHAYNEGNGPSFQVLAIDGMQHGEFHLRFLEYSLAAGFDPFKLALAGSGQRVAPVFGHESLADAAQNNRWSARMRACLQDLARIRFGAATTAEGLSGAELVRTMAYCRDSFPADLLEALAARLAGTGAVPAH